MASHVRLDGDALGSELAMYRMLANMGKEVVVYNEDEAPGNYRFLPDCEKIVHHLPDPGGFEVAVVLDCSELERIGKEAGRVGTMKQIINIDHHVSNERFGGLSYVDPEASSTGEMLYRLFSAAKVELAKDMATNLYAAILTDTGGFRYRNTSKDTLIASGKLVENGADPQWISENIYESNDPAKIELLSRALNTLSFDWDKKVGCITIMQRTLAETGSLMEHTEGLVDIPRSVRGIEVSILFVEMSDRYFKVSLRSKGKINVERIARAFGGGGHINAAACHLEGEIDVVRRLVLDVIGEIGES